MSIQSKTYFGTPGQTSITDYQLAFVTVLRVTRSTRTYSKVDGTPAAASLQFSYDHNAGKIQFDPANPFYGPGGIGRPDRYQLERITVKYKV